MACYPHAKKKVKTVDRGYGHDHRKASERYRAEHPLCEACVMTVGVIEARPSRAMHHIAKVADAPDLRMRRSNWLALCDSHHAELEDQPRRAKEVKHWSERGYEAATERP